MSERRSAADLGSKLDAALHAFPFPERDWEADARRIVVRLSETARGSTDARLLGAPLPTEPGESSSTSLAATPLAQSGVTQSGVRSQSFSELARRSVEKKQAAQREIARATLYPVRSDSAGEFVSRASERQVASAPQPLKSNATERSSWTRLARIMPVVALAAVALLWLARERAHAPLAGSATGPATRDSSPSVRAAQTPAEPAQPRTPAQGPFQALPVNVAPTGQTTNNDAGSASDSPARIAASAASGRLQLSDKKRPHSSAAATPPRQAVDPALPADPAMRPADSSGGALPAKPSTGAVQAALGAVISGARRCVAADNAPSSAVVVFASSGRVEQVIVNGPAAGNSSGSCIQAQLSRARVQPFAAQNFSVNATVRPE